MAQALSCPHLLAPNQATEFAQHGASAEFQALLDDGFVSITSALSAHEMQGADALAKLPAGPLQF